MEAILYAEIYLFCIVIVWLCKYWSDQRSSNSASERWLHTALVGFLVCFISNFLFTLVNRVLPATPVTRHASWLFKTAYHVMLYFGVFAWCGYADTECRGTLFTTRKRVMLRYNATSRGCLTASKQARQRKRRVERYFFVNIKIYIYTLCHGML